MERIALQRAILIDQQVANAGNQGDDECDRDQRHEAGKLEAARLGTRHAVER